MGASRDQKKASDCLELELQNCVNHQDLVPGKGTLVQSKEQAVLLTAKSPVLPLCFVLR